jgi:hypothetical protein
MDNSNTISTILVSAFTILGSAAAWRFYEKRALSREKSENFIRDDCRERIAKLEAILSNSSKEKEMMRVQVLKLTSEVSELRVKVEFLEKENSDLSRKLNTKNKLKK